MFARIWLRVSLSNLVQTCSILAQLSSFDWLRNGDNCHGGFWQKLILTTNIVLGPHFHPLFQIWCKSVQKQLSYGRLTDFKMASAAILYFWPMWILTVNLALWSSFQPTYQMNSAQIYAKMAEVWFSIWRWGLSMGSAVFRGLLALKRLDRFPNFKFWTQTKRQLKVRDSRKFPGHPYTGGIARSSLR